MHPLQLRWAAVVALSGPRVPQYSDSNTVGYGMRPNGFPPRVRLGVTRTDSD
jgi:hypothetical protein